jgi:hypothetical protein
MPPALLACISCKAAGGGSGFAFSVMAGAWGQPGPGGSRLALYRIKPFVGGDAHPVAIGVLPHFPITR